MDAKTISGWFHSIPIAAHFIVPITKAIFRFAKAAAAGKGGLENTSTHANGRRGASLIPDYRIGLLNDVKGFHNKFGWGLKFSIRTFQIYYKTGFTTKLIFNKLALLTMDEYNASGMQYIKTVKYKYSHMIFGNRRIESGPSK